jgi:hypothetical protein
MQGETMSTKTITYYDTLTAQPVTLQRTTETVTRLNPQDYERLLQNLQAKGKPTMSKDPLEAAFMLGMQHVLEKLREGFVIGA